MAKRIAAALRVSTPGDVAVWEALRFLYCDRLVVAAPGAAARLADEYHHLDGVAGLSAGERIERLCQFAVDVLGATTTHVQAHLARAGGRTGGIGPAGRAERRRRLTTTKSTTRREHP